MEKNLSSLIDNYINHLKRDFTLAEIFEDIEGQIEEDIPHLESRVKSLLSENQLIFTRQGEDLYIPRAGYFKHSRFLINPTPEEIKGGFLIPGHRFIPFCHPEIFPGTITMSLEGREVKRTKAQKRFKELYIYHNLIGLDRLPEFLLFDSESNAQMMESENPEEEIVSLTVFDLKDFYENTGFRIGDAIEVVVKDWHNGIYEMNFSPAAERGDRKKVLKWISKMDKAFDSVFSGMGLPLEMEEQIAYAFFFSGDYVIKNPLIHFGGFLAQSKKVSFKQLGGKTFLWYEDEEPGMDDLIRLSEISGNFDSLEDILKDIKSSVTLIEIEAHMRDELYNRASDYSAVLKRCFKNWIPEFFDSYQEDKFHLYLKEHWEEIKTSYNFFTDQKRGKIRNWALKIFEKWHEWFKKLDDEQVSMDALPQEEIINIRRYLDGLNHIFNLCNHENDISEMEEVRIYHFLDETESYLGNAVKIIEENIKPKLSLVRHEESAAPYFVLKISLKGAKPPIWRRIMVSGNARLSALHRAIQILFEWEECHLHEFKIKERFYGAPGKEDLYEVIDEETILLREIIDQAKQKFLYTYDFGDSWEHQIAVEKILSSDEVPEKGQDFFFLGGRKAAPPEDSGGIWGYQSLQEVLADKKHPEYDELLEWIGGEPLNPDFIDTEAIREKFSRGGLTLKNYLDPLDDYDEDL